MDTTHMIYQLKVNLWNLAYTHWKTTVLFSGRWWSLVALIAIAYTVWWLLVDKRRLSQILLFGSFVAVGRIVMDIIGSDMVLWSYDIREVPFYPSPFLHDFTITPIACMLVYQYSHSWRRFLVLTGVATGIISFIFFPLLAALRFLTLYNWNYFYSFILIVVIASLSRAVLLGILQLEQKYQGGESSELSGRLIAQPAMKPLDKEDKGQDE